MNIVLVGYRGTGKTSVAKILAERLKWPLISTDAEIVKKAGLSVPEIIQKRGWDYFRDVETQICQRVGKKDRTIIEDRKSTRLNSSHGYISYAVFCLKKKKADKQHEYRQN